MIVRRRAPPLIPALAVGTTGGVLALLSAAGVLGQRAVFASLTLLLLIYLSVEIARVRRVQGDGWLINPAVVASVLTFGLSFALSNVLFFLPAERIEIVGLVPDVTPAMVKLMWLVLLGAIGMWLGYWLPMASGLASPAVRRIVSRWFSASDKPRKLALPALVALGLATRLLQIKLGVFGYSSSYDRLMEMGSFTQYLSMGASLGTVALVVASLRYFSERPRANTRAWFVFILVLEIVFGLLSGFKSQVVMPFVIVGACKYLRSGALPKVWLAWFFGALLFAYVAIEPFRAARSANDFQAASTAQIVDLFIASRGNDIVADNPTPVWLALAARSSFSYIGSLGVSYKDEVKSLPEGTPDFLRNIALAPAYAFIPRLIWKSKPAGDVGLWYTQNVMGHEMYSSTAMGPVTYLYFAGGAFAVFVGLLCFGVLHKLLVLLVPPAAGSARAFVYLSLLPTVANINSAVDGTVVALLRMVPLLLLLQYLIYQRVRPAHARRQAR